jgi:hypothetical protein
LGRLGRFTFSQIETLYREGVKQLNIASEAESLPLPDIGHRFRGELFDKCGVIERWATDILAATGGKAKARYLFGKKLGAVRELAERDLNAEQPQLKNPKHVRGLLNRFNPYAELRCHLAHAVQTIAIRSDGEQVFIFEPVSPGKVLPIALTEEIQRRILREVSFLAKELLDQRVRDRP